MSKKCAVITGDVVSSRVSGPEVWMPALKAVMSEFGQNPEDWDIHRGDAFQLLLPHASDAFYTAMQIKAGFKRTKGLDLRMAIGVGELSFRAKTVGESSGSAFIHSGALLDALEQRHETLAIASLWPDLDESLNAGMGLAAALMDKWLPNYAQAMASYLAEPSLTQQALSKKLGIAQNTLSERQTKAHRRELMAFNDYFKKAIRLKLGTK